MAKVKISPEFLSEIVFGYTDHPVEITGGFFDPNSRQLTLTISGYGVPKTDDQVECNVTVTTNRVGQRLMNMTFTEMEKK